MGMLDISIIMNCLPSRAQSDDGDGDI
jgi:hypothetical protein